MDIENTLNALSLDFRNFNGTVLLQGVKDLVPQTGKTIYYFYSLFNFIGSIYLYRLLRIFSTSKILPILLVFLYLGIEQIFTINFTITYVNITISSLIIFLYYLFALNKYRNTSNYILYIFSYLFLIASRPDFFFLAITIEILNAYFKNNNVITLGQNIFFYLFLIPYYLVINNYLLSSIHRDAGLLGNTYVNNNFWDILFNKFISGELFEKFLNNIEVISKDLFFSFTFIFVIGVLTYFYIIRKIKNSFNYIFLLFYSILFFFIVIFIHIEGFIDSSFKYFSIIYTIFFILFSLLVIRIYNLKITVLQKKIINISIGLLLIINFSNSLYSYNKFTNIVKIGEKIEFQDKYTMNQRTYDILYLENILFHKLYLEGKVNKGCKNILIGKMHGVYNSLFSENKELFYRSANLNYKQIENENCLNVYIYSEKDPNNLLNHNQKLSEKIFENFETQITYDRYIDTDLWLNLYIMNNKNVK